MLIIYYFIQLLLVCTESTESHYRDCIGIAENSSMILQALIESYSVSNIDLFILASEKCLSLTAKKCDEISIIETLIVNSKERIWKTATEQQLIRFLQPLAFITTKPRRFYAKMRRIYDKCEQIKSKLGTELSGKAVLYPLLDSSFRYYDTKTAERIFKTLCEMDIPQERQTLNFIKLYIFDNNIGKLYDMTTAHLNVTEGKSEGNILEVEVVDGYVALLDIEMNQEICLRINAYLSKLFQNEKYQMIVDLANQMVTRQLVLSADSMRIRSLSMINLIRRNEETINIHSLQTSLETISYHLYSLTRAYHQQQSASDIESVLKELVKLDVIGTIDLFGQSDIDKVMTKIDKWANSPLPYRSWILFESCSLNNGYKEETFDIGGFSNNYIKYLVHYIYVYRRRGNPDLQRKVFLICDASQQETVVNVGQQLGVEHAELQPQRTQIPQYPLKSKL